MIDLEEMELDHAVEPAHVDSLITNEFVRHEAATLPDITSSDASAKSKARQSDLVDTRALQMTPLSMSSGQEGPTTKSLKMPVLQKLPWKPSVDEAESGGKPHVADMVLTGK